MNIYFFTHGHNKHNRREHHKSRRSSRSRHNSRSSSRSSSRSPARSSTHHSCPRRYRSPTPHHIDTITITRPSTAPTNSDIEDNTNTTVHQDKIRLYYRQMCYLHIHVLLQYACAYDIKMYMPKMSHIDTMVYNISSGQVSPILWHICMFVGKHKCLSVCLH